jgi:ketosteroid isomerase-like protein
MSEENVEFVRQLFDLVNRGDLEGLAAVVPPHFELDFSASRGLNSKVYRGPGEISQLFADIPEAWSEYELFESEMIDAGDTVIRVGGVRGRGRGSGIEVMAEGATVWRFDGGTPASGTLHQSKEQALEAAGLSE